jgi:hypothetical protein
MRNVQAMAKFFKVDPGYFLRDDEDSEQTFADPPPQKSGSPSLQRHAGPAGEGVGGAAVGFGEQVHGLVDAGVVAGRFRGGPAGLAHCRETRPSAVQGAPGPGLPHRPDPGLAHRHRRHRRRLPTPDQDRMDLTGARWPLPSAEAVLKLRALHSNGGFDDYWNYHLTQEKHRTHEVCDEKEVIPSA